MHLINTIEINPFDFCRQEYDYSGSNPKDLDERYQFWKKCISDSGLGRLEAISKDSYLVDIQTINDDELAVILTAELKEVDLSHAEEQVGTICGGPALHNNDGIYITPSCCGDIGNIREWESISEKASHVWHQLWIGHPWVYFRKGNGFIEFSGYTESNLEDLKDIQILVKVDEQALFAELKKLREQQEEFQRRIQKVLDKIGVENSKRVSELMSGHM
ncbi:hypothetical protein HGH92_08460 [Chitinophaga varians]|uniref:Uncharacterized protein n=1 Tax=Chitinophaga varians TaxID=2202339 RepID=A0A847RTY5_9BACT|nr:hypothetical protein [Chitinophaga varians]NLR64335.1 hypothetical protein [Chitinophaga varians]